MKAQLLVDGRHELGEGVLWCERSQSLFWTDIHASRLWNHDPQGGVTRSWELPERLCCFAFTADANRLLVGLASRLAFLALDSGLLTPICEVEPDLPTTRLNDGRCDRQGRFVFGTLNEDPGRAPIGSFYRLDTDLSLERLPLPGVAISNSICFSPAGDVMYYCDSMQGKIMCCDYDVAGCSVANPRVFADIAGAGGPDGSCVDAEGLVWNARWGGSRVVRLGADGSVERTVEVPATQVSCVAFGGPDLATLYITTAHEGMDAAQRAADEWAGGIFSLPLDGVRGLPEVRFGA
ncbi:SMP-30/gluconolactonase/LRE family protein [Herbaspirillum sp. YR522]|uniref:SMP-30/gluconolactonase/LRE family protein n=1 Tax=Herbaspirillum sp. YR522 TaxID=1144342 RepID=UPI00026FB365|nr:SMP-30/gluconolactonase/LRE family protein [Herbaspirillum sp. YR522]EJN07715.1 gluconolactonase [Herbaspirillum sp. YR522]